MSHPNLLKKYISNRLANMKNNTDSDYKNKEDLERENAILRGLLKFHSAFSLFNENNYDKLVDNLIEYCSKYEELFAANLSSLNLKRKLLYAVNSQIAGKAKTDSEELILAIINNTTGKDALGENIQDIIIRFDLNKRITYINSAGLFFFNLKEKETLGKNQLELSLFDSENSDFWESQMDDAMVLGKSQRLEIKMDNVSHSSYWDWYITPEFDEKSRVEAILCLARDITEMSLIQIALEKAKIRAEEADSLKSAFLTNMSHEIRTPMNGIIGFSGLLMQSDLKPEERLEFAQILNKSSIRLMDLINNILDLSKIDAKQIPVVELVFDGNKLFYNLEEIYSPQAKTKNLEFIVECGLPAEFSDIYSDEMKIMKILKIFTENAVKFTYTGKIRIGYEYWGGSIRFFVEDTGVGISDEYIDKICNRFSQEETSLNRNHEGSGLGLSIAKGLIELLDGSFLVESQKDKGSTFSFSIPIKQSENEFNETEKDIHSNEGIKSLSKKVIIAEDDEISFILLNNLIQKESDYQVLHAPNGKAAVELAKVNSDAVCIFMDMKMPVMDGWTATQKIKKMFPDMPIIAITALAMMGDREKALEVGCTDYLTKPFNPKEVVSLLRKYA